MKREDAIVAALGTIGLAFAIVAAFGRTWAWTVVVVIAAGLVGYYLGSIVVLWVAYGTRRRRRG
jgi:uncharacterized YccA/Bax inhibitor family protein